MTLVSYQLQPVTVTDWQAESEALHALAEQLRDDGLDAYVIAKPAHVATTPEIAQALASPSAPSSSASTSPVATPVCFVDEMATWIASLDVDAHSAIEVEGIRQRLSRMLDPRITYDRYGRLFSECIGLKREIIARRDVFPLAEAEKKRREKKELRDKLARERTQKKILEARIRLLQNGVPDDHRLADAVAKAVKISATHVRAVLRAEGLMLPGKPRKRAS